MSRHTAAMSRSRRVSRSHTERERHRSQAKAYRGQPFGVDRSPSQGSRRGLGYAENVKVERRRRVLSQVLTRADGQPMSIVVTTSRPPASINISSSTSGLPDARGGPASAADTSTSGRHSTSYTDANCDAGMTQRPPLVRQNRVHFGSEFRYLKQPRKRTQDSSSKRNLVTFPRKPSAKDSLAIKHADSHYLVFRRHSLVHS